MRYYEISILISPELSEKELNDLEEKIVSFLQDEKGILVKINKSVKKNLGYPIKKKSQVFFFNLDFQLNPENLEKIKNNLKKESSILRFFLLKKKPPRAKEIEIKKPRVPKKIIKPKVELKEIEKKLEEILTQ